VNPDQHALVPVLDQLASQGGAEGFIFRHFWVACILVTVINGVTSQRSVKPAIERDPLLADGYRCLFRGYYVWMNVPWVLMGLGIVFGGVGTMQHYFLAFDRAPVVLWWCAMAGLQAYGSVWMLLRGGAETLARHPGLPFVPRVEARTLKLVWIAFAVLNVLYGVLIATVVPTLTDAAPRPMVPTPLFVVGFFIAFPAMWIGIGFLLSMVSGWSSLARDYRIHTAFDGPIMHMRSGRLGVVNYSSCLNLGSNREGLYVATLFLFRIGSPPLFIPWADITHQDTKRLFFFDITEIRFAKHPTVVLELRRALAHELLAQRPKV